MVARVERLVTSGTFSLDGGTWEVDNNVWLLGDDDEVVVVDAAHDAEAILAAVDGRTVLAVVCTHGHDAHIGAAGEVADRTGAPVLLHPDDLMLWKVVHPDRTPSQLADGDVLEVAGVAAHVLHTPGHAPGAVCLHVPALGVVLT
ncbi:MAG: MBL fold metallo-hydrolase, partial [Actinomycetes bacterium]